MPTTGHGILALMGSGETSPTMVTLHRELAALLPADPDALILETPYGFQINRDDISARAREYFQRSVGLATVVLPDDDAPAGASAHAGPDAARDHVRRADWVFSGPGSPSYALGRWEAQGLAEVFVERVRRGHGVTVMASAAACTVGLAALPVYEIYKAGHPPRWLSGLDLLGPLGLPVTVIPHYDNAEGRTHDTRYCYLSETRLTAMERQLPDGSAVLGIDEHTALVIDLAHRRARVWGHGVLTVRRGGISTTVPAGTNFTLDDLRELVAGGTAVPISVPGPHEAGDRPSAQPVPSPVTLQEAVGAAEARFDTAHGIGDAAGMIEAVLDLDAVIAEWSADTEEDEGGTQWARTVLRGMIRQLGPAAQQGMSEPARTLDRVLGPLLELRRSLRSQGAYELADRLRAAFAAGGVEIRDGAERTTWRLTEDERPRPASPHSTPPSYG
ncbi:hypothetical protein AB0399_05335 [Streptomyces sp. NPDC088194]|uniref:hypothetical protein n=1 Tax=Streptomyces sp. NPDC088194 TaxID=3154931 RepID=UPI00344F54E4